LTHQEERENDGANEKPLSNGERDDEAVIFTEIAIGEDDVGPIL